MSKRSFNEHYGGGNKEYNDSPREITLPEPTELKYGHINKDEVMKLAKLRAESGGENASKICFVITNTFTLDSCLDLTEHYRHQLRESMPREDTKIFGIGKTVTADPNDPNHDRKIIFQLTNVPYNESRTFNQSVLDTACLRTSCCQREENDAKTSGLAQLPTTTLFTRNMPYIHLSTREFKNNNQLIAAFKEINARVSAKRKNNPDPRIRQAMAIPAIVNFARMPISSISFQSKTGLGLRTVACPRSFYGYTPDSVADQNVYRVWLSNKDTATTMLSILESFEFNDKHGMCCAYRIQQKIFTVL
jgi:hypothetical protein